MSDRPLPAYDHAALEAILGGELPEQNTYEGVVLARIFTDALQSRDATPTAGHKFANALHWLRSYGITNEIQGERQGKDDARSHIKHILGLD